MCINYTGLQLYLLSLRVLWCVDAECTGFSCFFEVLCVAVCWSIFKAVVCQFNYGTVIVDIECIHTFSLFTNLKCHIFKQFKLFSFPSSSHYCHCVIYISIRMFCTYHMSRGFCVGSIISYGKIFFVTSIKYSSSLSYTFSGMLKIHLVNIIVVANIILCRNCCFLLPAVDMQHANET